MMRIKLHNISKRFGNVWALRELDLSLAKGDLLLIEGPNGAGKSTLLRLLAMAIAPDEGKVLWDGKETDRSLDHVRGNLGYLGSAPGLYEDLSLQDNLNFWADVYGLAGGEPRRQRLWESIALWKLAHYRHRPVRIFSEGMKKRAGLAKLTLLDPKVFLLDEPFNGLDEEGVATLLGMLSAAGQEKIIAVATHQAAVMGNIANKRLRLVQGRDEGAAPKLPKVALKT